MTPPTKDAAASTKVEESPAKSNSKFGGLFMPLEIYLNLKYWEISVNDSEYGYLRLCFKFVVMIHYECLKTKTKY